MSYQIGDIIPSITLQDTDGNHVTIKSGTDKYTILLFFPLAFTGVCTTEMCTVRDNMKVYESLGTNVFGISIDSFFCFEA